MLARVCRGCVHDCDNQGNGRCDVMMDDDRRHYEGLHNTAIGSPLIAPYLIAHPLLVFTFWSWPNSPYQLPSSRLA